MSVFDKLFCIYLIMILGVTNGGFAEIQQYNIMTSNLWTTPDSHRCDQLTIDLVPVKLNNYPTVFLAIFIERPTPFITEFFQYISELNYPKHRLTLFIHYKDNFHDGDVTTFMEQSGDQYNSKQIYKTANDVWDARKKANELCVTRPEHCQYLFSVDGEAHLENPSVLTDLIQANSSVVAPMLVKPGGKLSNFKVTVDGYKDDSDPGYNSILKRNLTGVWNIPQVKTAYLIHGSVTTKLADPYEQGKMFTTKGRCLRMTELGISMYVDNQKYYGHLIDTEKFTTEHLHNDLYQIMDNQYAWDKKYIHPEFRMNLKADFVVEQPCTDVYWFPMVTPTFCSHLVEEMENLDQWSKGALDDNGYDVPTVDTLTTQIGWRKHWLLMLVHYVAPMVEKLYTGFHTESRTENGFVVRYRPTEQDRLKKHHDSSTYSVNGALNRVHVDYEGGGVRFTRYNCSVTELRLGWFLMHPGLLTHEHEGLPTTNGTRYILVSFIDPV